jgi:CheY-like chemotaxis protein
MPRIRLIHWNDEERAERAKALRAAGYDVDSDAVVSQASFKAIRANPPDAFVIDLSRLPSHGRDVALAMREAKSTRHVPIVFAGGTPDKIARVMQSLPDATFTTWRGIRGALKKAIAKPPENPVVPASSLAGYSGTPLPKKLGIKEGFTVALVDAPEGFEAVLGALPENVRLLRNPKGARSLTLWFVRDVRALEKKIDAMAAHGDPGLWICWPKKTSALASDIGEPIVRHAGLARGIVDYKVCAVDATWSGLKFAKRKR